LCGNYRILNETETFRIRRKPIHATTPNQRSRIETQMGRWKAVIGPKLKARNFTGQKTEANIGVRVLNRMTALGRPCFAGSVAKFHGWFLFRPGRGISFCKELHAGTLHGH
jgi:hypothetical protein